jgi:hypothetical protein
MKQDENEYTKLIKEVAQILDKKGYSSLFYTAAFNDFKELAKGSFNEAEEIAQLFINDAQPMQCDYYLYKNV